MQMYTQYTKIFLMFISRFTGVDEALQNVKDKMEILCTTDNDNINNDNTNNSLENVLCNMKDTLSSIRSQVIFHFWLKKGKLFT